MSRGERKEALSRKGEGGGGAPSNLAVIGRDILTLEVIAGPGRTKQGWGHEIQLTDAIADQARSGAPVFEAHWVACNLWL